MTSYPTAGLSWAFNGRCWMLCMLAVLTTNCGAQSLSKKSPTEGCRIYDFGDVELALQEQFVLKLNAVVDWRPRLLEVVMKVPERLSADVQRISVYPAGPSLKTECIQLDESGVRRCRTIVENTGFESSLIILGDGPSEYVLDAAQSYLQRTVCGEQRL